MIEAARIREIVGQYEKHGWTPRRVLLRAPESLASALPENLFGGAPIAESDIDALWFSRRAAAGGEAWELRRLTDAPLAFVEVFGAGEDEAAREQKRREIEAKMRAR